MPGRSARYRTYRGLAAGAGASAAPITPPAISYAGSPFYWLGNEAITQADPTNTGGAVDSYAVGGGTLPTGISLNTTTGAITGTPTDAGTSPVTIRATNAGGFSDAAVTFTAWAPWWGSQPANTYLYVPASAYVLDSGGSPVTNGTAVATWTERLASGEDLAQSNSDHRPVWYSDPEGNGPAILGDGSNDHLDNTTFTHKNTPQTWIVALHLLTTGTWKVPLCRANDESSIMSYSNNSFHLRKNDGGGSTQITPTNTWDIPQVVSLELSDIDTGTGRYNGGNDAAVDPLDSFYTNHGGLSVLATNSGSRAANAYVYGVVFYPSVDAAYRAKCENYFKARLGL